MHNSNNMISLFIIILLISTMFFVIMFFVTGLEILSQPYTKIISENPDKAIILISSTIVGLAIITFFSKYFFEKDTKKQDSLDKYLEYYLR